jgi:hypothetical protein
MHRKKKKKGFNISKQKLEDLARAMGKLMDSMPFDRSKCNHKVYCKSCREFFCLGFDGIDCHCPTCFYTVSCTKETTGYRICQKCGGPR